MTFLKKILPFLIVAIVFVVGGYFVGSGMNTEQGAALYTGVKQIPCGDRVPCPPIGDPAPIKAGGTTNPAAISKMGCRALADISGSPNWTYDSVTGCTIFGWLSASGTGGPNGIMTKGFCENAGGVWFQSSYNTGICNLKPTITAPTSSTTKTQ